MNKHIATAAVLVVLILVWGITRLQEQRLTAETRRMEIMREERVRRADLCASYRLWTRMANETEPGMEELCR